MSFLRRDVRESINPKIKRYLWIVVTGNESIVSNECSAPVKTKYLSSLVILARNTEALKFPE